MTRRVLLLALASSWVLLACAPMGHAGTQPPPQLATATSSHATRAFPAAASSTALSGPCTVTGQVLRPSGAVVAGAIVYVLYASSGEAWVAATATTAADGSFAVTGVPETSAGEIDVSLPGGDSFRVGGLTYTEAGPNSFVLRPGLVAARLSARPGSTWRPPLIVETYGSGGAASTSVGAISGSVLAMAPDLRYAVAYTHTNQGIEWFASSPRAIASGMTNGSLVFDLGNARSTWLTAPAWASGRPGATVSLALNNWPKNTRIGFSGYPMAPAGPAKTWSPTTASGKATISRALVLPASAPPGYAYTILVSNQRAGSHLELNLTFQVASLVSSRASVAHGQSLRLSGRVPTQGHWGDDTPGKAKLVTLYKRTTAAGQPTQWDARRNGWTVVGTYTTDRYGDFKSVYLRPTRTTWFVLRYAGDGQYHPGFTSVLRVPVK